MNNNDLKIFGISLAMLFMEIFLIRWISTEIRIFAYLSNLVLLACFLGIGVGCYYSNKKSYVFVSIAILVFFAFLIYAQPFQNITYLLSGFSDSVIWEQTVQAGSYLRGLLGIALTVFIFILIAATFIPLGQILGNLLDEHNNIIYAYSINIVASLLGIWAFNMFSFLSTPPWMWFAFSLSILIFFVPRTAISYISVIAAFLLIFFALKFYEKAPVTIWSPYQKLEIYNNGNKAIHNGYVLKVNNTNYMSLSDLSESFTHRYPTFYPYKMVHYNQYTIPSMIASSNNNVLIVGAGGGNDVAGALRGGAKSIDAVEIDPGIIAIGTALHPEMPYINSRVNLVNDDARAFFKKTKKHYDIISFGLLDSHTLGSNYNNIRLDHYVYTLQSFQEAKKLLTKDGIITVTFAMAREWIGDRIYKELKTVFGDVPLSFGTYYTDLTGTGWGAIMFVSGNNPEAIMKMVKSKPGLREYIASTNYQFPGKEKIITDDWPYLYLQDNQVPKLYLYVSICIIFIILMAKSFLLGRKGHGIDWHFFFLGSAFLLLEFQNISKVSLLLGSTWVVNAYIISAILILILLANIMVYYSRSINVKYFYGILFVLIVLLYFFPLEFLNNFSYPIKSIFGSVILNIPLFFASVIFITSFKQTPSKNIALGSNLIGATAGGVLECLSFVVGIKALLIVVLFLYALSYFCLKETRTS